MGDLAQVVDWLTCPQCGTPSPLKIEDAGLVCAQQHRFDRARQGYVNLTGRAAPRHADTTDMVRARQRILAQGVFEPLAERLSAQVMGRQIADLGAGPGYYLARVMSDHPQGVGLATDISVPAVKLAARAHPRMAAIVADTWQSLPIRDGCLDTVISVFAPRHPSECWRILRPGGAWLVVIPSTDHLGELRTRYALMKVDSDKASRLNQQLSDFDLVDTQAVRYQVSLDAGGVKDMILMGPNAFHLEQLVTQPARVTIDVQVHILRRLG